MKRLMTALVATAALTLSTGAGAAAAAEPAPPASSTTDPAPRVSPADYAALIAALRSDGAQDTGDGFVTYAVDGVGDLTLPAPNAKGGPDRISAGGGITSPYVSFNRTDQSAILAGGSAGVAAAICAIPAAGQAVCVAAIAIAAAATVYLNEYGRCPTSAPNLRIYAYNGTDGCYR